MSTATRQVLHGWPTRRLELMRTRVCELPAALEGSFYDAVISQVRRELERRGLSWFPHVYLSTGWHCPDRIPVVGVPFSLATHDLRHIEKEVTNEVEPRREMARLLRHEVGHAFNYVFRLYETPEWRLMFGTMSRPYRQQYVVRPSSRQFVRHLWNHYAQKHPDEDFAETFAVWLGPRTTWRRQYRGWGALRKLEYVDRVVHELRGVTPAQVKGPRVEPMERLRYTLAQHYHGLGYPMNEYGFEEEAAGYVDEDLRSVFDGARSRGTASADIVLRRLRRRIVDHVVHLLGVRPDSAQELYDKYVDRAADLRIRAGIHAEQRLLVGVTTMMTTHLLNLRHTGRFNRVERLVGCR